MRDQAEKKKPTELRDDHHDPQVGCMVQHEEMVTQRLAVLKIETQHKTAPKSLDFVNYEDPNDNEEEEPVAKKYRSLQSFEMGLEDSENSDDQDTLRHPLKVPQMY